MPLVNRVVYKGRVSHCQQGTTRKSLSDLSTTSRRVEEVGVAHIVGRWPEVENEHTKKKNTIRVRMATINGKNKDRGHRSGRAVHVTRVGAHLFRTIWRKA